MNSAIVELLETYSLAAQVRPNPVDEILNAAAPELSDSARWRSFCRYIWRGGRLLRSGGCAGERIGGPGKEQAIFTAIHLFHWISCVIDRFRHMSAHYLCVDLSQS
ncbi:hypothetical protein [Sphingopyxis macrogoltabida]|uniref:hypothetical protein n=1 Tax=Sphingopyxis macrogoltabida TaxID=33050 RepID=UPI001314A879|nr:hypothetical protein [Sphingopyxis macrogoltabida]